VQSVSVEHAPVLQADVEAHSSELSQVFVIGVQACVLSQALVVRVDPVHDGLPQDVPIVG
jgi:hypothetical protein